MRHVRVKPKASRTKASSTRLTPRQLRRLADRMVASSDPAEVARLKKELERGFYAGLIACGDGELTKTFLRPDQAALGEEID